MGTSYVEVFGEVKVLNFARRHPRSRSPLVRLLNVVRAATWGDLVELKATFASADYAPRTKLVIFNVGGNHYRLTANIDYEEQIFRVESVLTHEEYDREVF
jgi:mRNA interferase HigB